MPIIAPDPFGSFIQGKQARQQQDYGATRNKLAEMDLQNAPAEMQRRNALGDQQVEQGKRQLDADKARQAYAQLSQALDSGNPKAFVLQNIPDLARHLQQSGTDINSMDDQTAAQFIQNMARNVAGAAGIAPAAKAGPMSPQGKVGADVRGGYLTPEQGSAAMAPKPDHFAEAEAGRNARSQAAIDARPGNMPADQSNVDVAAQAIANYQQKPLAAYAMRSPYGQAVMARVMELNPDYQANEFDSRSKAYKDFATGKNGNQVRSFNVAISHLDSLQKMADALGNGDVPALNKLKNAFSRETGKAAPNTFEGMKKIVTDELVKAIVGAGGGVADREEAAKTIAAANSPEQLAGIMDGYKELMAGQLGGLQQQYEQTTGRKDFQRYLSPASTQYLDKHMGGAQQPQAGPSDEISSLLDKYAPRK